MVLCCQTVGLDSEAAGQTSDQRDQRETERLACLSSFLCLIFLMGRSVIIVHSSAFFFSLSRFRSLWATCMTVTMTASGAQLLLLALCACRGWTMQSAPRVRLPFKGELARTAPSSGSRPPFPAGGGYVSSLRVCKDGISCRNVKRRNTGNKRWILRVFGPWRKKINPPTPRT